MAKMPHSRKWQQILTGTYGKLKADALISEAQTYYDRYWRQYSSEKDPGSRSNLKTRVLPGLSIYQVLLKENQDQEGVLAEVETLFRAAFFTKLMWGIRILNYLPDPFPIVRPALRMMTRGAYLPDVQEIIDDCTDCFALNVYRCFIFDTLTAHHAAELTVLYCNTDDWLSERVPKIRWERTKTLGRGDDFCDFRWSRIQ